MLKQIQEIQSLATKYSKAQLGRMVQMGVLDPQKAMMAGMMIQRIEAQNAQPPETTVAQELLGLPAVGGQQPQPQQAQQMQQPPQQQAPQMGAPVEQPTQMAASGGLTDIPVEMQDYAGGGMVSFDDGGEVDGYAGGGVPKKSKYDELIYSAAQKANIDPEVFRRLIFTESSFNPNAVSYAGRDAGLGIAQISKHHKLTEAQRLDPKFSLGYAAKYFKGLVDKSEGDYRKALERYKGVASEKGRQRMAKAISTVLGESYEAPATRLAAVTPTKQRRPKIDTIDNPFAVREEEIAQAPAPSGITGLGDINHLALLSTPYAQQNDYEMPEDAVGGFAGGGLAAFAGGGVPGFAGDDGSFVNYGLPFGGVSGGEEFFNKPVMPYGEQMRNVGNAFINALRRIISDPTMDERDRAEARAKLAEVAQQNYPDESSRGSATFADPAQAQKAPPVAAPPVAAPPKRRAGSNTDAPPIGNPPVLERLQLPPFNPNAIKLQSPTYDMPTIDKLEDITKEREATEEAAGYDKNLTAAQITKLTGKKGELTDLKNRAGGEALMQFGLGLIGARKGQEFQALSESGKAALGAYKNDLKDLRSAQEKLEEREDALRVADNQAKKTNSAADIAKRDAQKTKYDAAKLEVFKADTELTKTSALISSQTRGQDITAQTSLQDNQVRLQVAGMQAKSQREYANAIKENQLDVNIAKVMLDAEKNFMETQANNYIGKPNELAAAAREHAKRALQQYLPNSRPAANTQQVNPAQGGNRPPLTQFGS
jgi:soluble lytic murein transglycosylase-like protein